MQGSTGQNKSGPHQDQEEWSNLGSDQDTKQLKNLGPNRTSDYAVRESLPISQSSRRHHHLDGAKSEWCIEEKLRSLLAWKWAVLQKSVWPSLVGSFETSRKLFESKSSIFSSHFHDQNVNRTFDVTISVSFVYF